MFPSDYFISQCQGLTCVSAPYNILIQSRFLCNPANQQKNCIKKTYFIVSFIILILYTCSVNSPSRLPHYPWTGSDISSVIWLWVTLPQGLKIWIPYDYRHTEPPANSDLCRRNAIVSMTQCAFNHITTLLAQLFMFSVPVCFPVHLVDIWNVIEAFRENGINTMDLNADLSVARLEVVLSTIFYQLNKRMPTTHQITVEHSISLLLNFLLAAYDPWVTRDVTGGRCSGALMSGVLLTWADVVWLGSVCQNGVKIQTIYLCHVTTCSWRVREALKAKLNIF